MSSTKKGTFVLAVLVFVLGALILFLDHGKLSVYGVAWFVLALAGLTVCAISMASYRDELPDRAFQLFTQMYLTAGFFVLALGWALR
jgi:uncharacterized integral membrane protein